MTTSVGFLSKESSKLNFLLDESFIDEWKSVEPNFGFGGVGEITYLRTYSRLKDDGTKEQWWETIRRVVEGTYSIQRRHIVQNGLYWNAQKAQRSAQKMYRFMFKMKFLPPGRGLWAMGTDIIEKKNLFAALNNCAFVSTKEMLDDPVEPFTYMMDASMLGVGVGFDTKGADSVKIYEPSKRIQVHYDIPDTREGWVKALQYMLESFFNEGSYEQTFDYNSIREAGLPLKTFGGLSSGAEPLINMIDSIALLLRVRANSSNPYLSERDIVDIMNMIGACVVAGGIRRTAQIAFGSSSEFINLKDYNKNPEREKYGWASNNSYFAEVGDDYYEPASVSQIKGEPGYVWLENAQNYGRMGRNWRERYGVDNRAAGGNPCLEQTLESYEMCCLVETFPHRAENFEEYQQVLKYAYLYAKTVTLGRTHWTRANEVMLRNRRIGTSVSGVAQFIEANGIATLKSWLDEGYKTIDSYDIIYSEWFKVPRSIKITSVKPSGTVSLLAGATPGVHYPDSRYYIRRITINKHDPLVRILQRRGIRIEPHLMSDGKGNWNPSNYTVLASLPVDSGFNKVKPSMWEQLELAAFIQEWWADNQVSVTVTFDPETEGHLIDRALEFYQYRLKGVSFFPRKDLSADYPQLPYEEISELWYNNEVDMIKHRLQNGYIEISSKEFDDQFQDAIAESFCTTDFCEFQSH